MTVKSVKDGEKLSGDIKLSKALCPAFNLDVNITSAAKVPALHRLTLRCLPCPPPLASPRLLPVHTFLMRVIDAMARTPAPRCPSLASRPSCTRVSSAPWLAAFLTTPLARCVVLGIIPSLQG